MELWKEMINKVYLEGESTWPVTATYSKDGGMAVALTTSWNSSELRWEAILPYILEECTVMVDWTFQPAGSSPLHKIDSYEIITPLLTQREIKSIWEDATNEDVVEIEAVVRHIIQAHTGQRFGKRDKSIVVPGSGESALKLPERLISITGIKTLSAVLNVASLIIITDGWYLKKKYYDVVSEIDNTSVYWDGDGVYNYNDYPSEAPHGMGITPHRYGHGPIITPPGRSSGGIWKDDYPFTITGTWGYTYVPEAVKEAAKLLVNQYACSEQEYRDRYLDSIKAADWRLQFNAQAFLHTGSVKADQLLNDYVMKFGWGII